MTSSTSESKLVKLLNQLDNDNIHKRINAITTLGEVGDELCLQELRDRMKFMHDEYQALIIAIGKLKKRLEIK